eukprot:GEMP01064339.1.p1 GENE.GEMP01064339.1~~GEMP01064339.1.p1  ORF type:complete len:155 (+),score=48.98 GEMP01064339.1:118-582(+)
MTLHGDPHDGYQKLVHGDQRTLTFALDKAKEKLTGEALRTMKEFEHQLRDACRNEWQALESAGLSAAKHAIKRRAKIVNLEAKLRAAREKVDNQLRQTSAATLTNETLEAETKALKKLFADPDFSYQNLVTVDQLANMRAMFRLLQKDDDDSDD